MSNLDTERKLRGERSHRWEAKYEKERLRRLPPLEKLRIYEGFYKEWLRFNEQYPPRQPFSDKVEREAMRGKGALVFQEEDSEEGPR